MLIVIFLKKEPFIFFLLLSPAVEILHFAIDFDQLPEKSQSLDAREGRRRVFRTLFGNILIEVVFVNKLLQLNENIVEVYVFGGYVADQCLQHSFE
jgi:hypothetical protein